MLLPQRPRDLLRDQSRAVAPRRKHAAQDGSPAGSVCSGTSPRAVAPRRRLVIAAFLGSSRPHGRSSTVHVRDYARSHASRRQTPTRGRSPLVRAASACSATRARWRHLGAGLPEHGEDRSRRVSDRPCDLADRTPRSPHSPELPTELVRHAGRPSLASATPPRFVMVLHWPLNPPPLSLPARTCSKMSFRLVQELAADGVHVAVACRVLRVSTSGYFDWRGRPPSARAVADAELRAQIIEIHTCLEARTVLRVSSRSCGSVATCAATASGSHG